MASRDTIIKKITTLAVNKYPGAEIYLFGSQARGDARDFSDWDLLILLKIRNIPFEMETKLMDEFYDLELETGEIFSPLVYSKADWADQYAWTHLYKQIKKEGIRLI